MMERVKKQIGKNRLRRAINFYDSEKNIVL